MALQSLQQGLDQVDRAVAAKEQEITHLEKLQRDILALEYEKQEAEAEKLGIQMDETLTEEEKAAQIQAVDDRIAGKVQALEDSLSAAGVTRETLASAIAEKQVELGSLKSQVQMVEAQLAQQGLDRATLAENLATVKAALV